MSRFVTGKITDGDSHGDSHHQDKDGFKGRVLFHEWHAIGLDGTHHPIGHLGDVGVNEQPGLTTKSLWDRSVGLPQLVIERDGSDAVLRSYRYGLDLVNQSAGANTYYYHHDGLGSVADLTGNAGASLAWSEFYPYGLVRRAGSGSGAPGANPFGYTGEQLDGVTGLYHLRARQYDANTGRFLTTDPLAPLLTDPYEASYVYARNNPLLLTDRSGRCAMLCGLAAGAILGGAISGLTYVISAGETQPPRVRSSTLGLACLLGRSQGQLWGLRAGWHYLLRSES